MNQMVSRSVLAVAALAFAATVCAQETARMDQVVQQLVEAKQFMGSVLVARADQIAFNKAYGSANRFHRNPQGDVTHLTLTQGQFKGDARKK